MNTVEEWKQEKHPLDVVEDVKQYAAEGLSFAEIEERAGDGEWERLKWAGMYSHGRQDGYFMMRTKVPGGYLTPDQAEVIGEVAEKYATAPDEYGGEDQNSVWGDAFLDITTRQDVQKHWIEVEDVPEVWAKYDEVGLTTIQGCGDGARNVLGCPAAGLDDHECFDAQPVIDAVSDYFTGNREYANLPRKFKMTITGCKHDCGQSQINDVGLTPARKAVGGSDGDEEIYGFHCKVGGGLSDGPRMATGMDVFVPPGEAVEFCRAIAQTFKELGDRNNRGVCRMRYLVEQLGTDEFEQAVRRRCEVDLPESGTDLTEGYTGDHVGVHDQKEDGLKYVGFNVIAGRMGGDEFAAAARAARKYGTDEASIRLATDQNFLITHVPRENVGDLLNEPFARKYEPDPGPFSRGAVGCTGSEFCNYGIIETKNRVYRWAKALDRRIDTPDDLDVVRMHMSGCSASCAQPQIADIGFRGETVQLDEREARGASDRSSGEGTEPRDPEGTTNEEGDNSEASTTPRADGEAVDIVEGMDFGLGGSLGADNEFLDWVETAVPASAVIPAIEELFAAYVDEREDGERFYEWTRRVGNQRLRNVMQRADANVSGGVARGD
ncbi:nitrite and sulfite reductase 4Fe-4S domain-containing protein [Halosimplex carlsbadense 2-9-1]|uniref:Nitrite and sulfite reductase 4Fe-4S domain-containing protein n=1 Tax=Halosimplex carlsbadense 2-9-1 TaxID=797114 RepID=M0D652_9EURY|nr:nitrate/sulfite reductase [Halosimplex carlsbadense]ELZ29624.1 nitrite and sulfite reductase 4Fe-4S domain-containing protein [Halosimplex carlsbadense 2-9-1]